MSFIYSQALVAAFLADNSSDTSASVPLNGNRSPKPFLWHGKMIKPSRLSRFGITCKPLTANRGKELLTWWRGDFLASQQARLYSLGTDTDQLSNYLLEIKCSATKASGAKSLQSCSVKLKARASSADKDFQISEPLTNIRSTQRKKVESTPSGSMPQNSQNKVMSARFFLKNPLLTKTASIFGGSLDAIWPMAGAPLPTEKGVSLSAATTKKRMSSMNESSESSLAQEQTNELLLSFISASNAFTLSLNNLEVEQPENLSQDGSLASTKKKLKVSLTGISQETAADTKQRGKLQASAEHSFWVLLQLPNEQGEQLLAFMKQNYQTPVSLKGEQSTGKSNTKLLFQTATIERGWKITTAGNQSEVTRLPGQQKSSISASKLTSPMWLTELLSTTARISQLPVKEKDYLANDLACGLKCSELFARYNPVTASLKTVQCSLPGGLTASLQILPEQGSMRAGACYQHATLVPRIVGNECGFSHLTPTASEGAFGKTLSSGIYHVSIRGKVIRESRSGVMFQQMLSSQEKLLPQILEHIKKKKPLVPPPLRSKKSGLFKIRGKSAGQYHIPGLSVAVVASVDSKYLTRDGLLNPEFQEWLMGWPIGQTGLKPLATGKYQEWLRQHSFS